MRKDRPNILWICTDQQRFDTLGCYGNPYVRTPNIDKLAANGILFENAFCQNPICTPSRSSFLTGRYPRTTRNRQNGQSIPDDEVLVTRRFRDTGYACGLAGKFHLSACNPDVSPTSEPRIDDGYDLFEWSHSPKANWAVNQYTHWLKERGVEYRTRPHSDCKYIEIGMPAEFHQTTWCVERAVRFIEGCGDRPWLFSINFFDPHAPFDPPETHLLRYSGRLDELPEPNYVPGELDNKPALQQLEYELGLNSGGIKKRYKCADMSETDHRYVKAAYYAMVELIDEQVGVLLDALEKNGQADNTLIVFMSDHGELLGDHGMYYKGPFFYEPAVKVPLIMSWPNVLPPGRRSKALVELVDLAQTLLEAAGIPEHAGMQGKSMWRLLTGDAPMDQHREDVYCEFYNSLPWNKPGAYCTMLRTDRHKLVVHHGQSLGELYDLQADPSETHNRWNDMEHAGVKTELLLRLCDRMAWTVDPLPLRKAPW